MKHIYQGDCPDENQPDARDPNCPACRPSSMTELPKLRDTITAADFGVPAEFQERAEHYARWAVAKALEDAAKACEERHANGNRKYTHADECAAAVRGMIK